MKALNCKYILLLLAFLGAWAGANATHLVGGSMSYQYVGRLSNGNFQYRVTLKVYRDCQASQVPFDDEIDVGVYHASGNRPLASSWKFSKISEIQVDPPSGVNCPNMPQVCFREAIYTRLIDVPSTNFGYHIVWKRCCRNTQNNIVDDMGQTYYAFIPNTGIRNSSPFFTEVPAPYICINDTTIYLNGASDPDGDSLSYKLVHPWSGLNAITPTFSPPSTFPDPTNDEVIYRGPYNEVIPFGSTGLASINVANGLTTMLARSLGRFALAIEVTEWRNGQPLSRIRLDVQIIVVNCEPNNKPDIAPTTGNFFKNVTVGNTLCFDVQASDVNANQAVTINARGDIFGGAGWQGPVATFTKKTATGVVTSQFCWTPSCKQARSSTYNFVVDAMDNGCPPKSRSVTFFIKVDPFIGEQNITGPTKACEGDLDVVYSVPNTPGSTYKWTVTGGTISGPPDQSSVKVNWATSGAGKVQVLETSVNGCEGLPASLNVIVAEKPIPKRIAGQDTVCEFSGNMLYQVTPIVGYTYQWIVTGGTIISSTQPHQIRINWGGIGEGKVMVIETNLAGCPGDTNKLTVIKTRSLLDTIYGSPSVCPNLRGVEYYVIGRPGASYRWFVEGGTLRSGDGTSKIIVDWGGIGIGKVKVIETLKWGCIGDTVRYTVIKNHTLAGYAPIGKDSVCEFTTAVRYEVIKTNGSSYFWKVNGGTFAKYDTSHWVLVDWGKTGTGYVEVFETSYDSVSNIPCIGPPTRINVVINPLPTADEIIGKFELCQLSGTYQYTLNGFPGSRYLWAINGDTSKITGQGTKTISVDWKLDGNFILSVMETTKDSCTNFVVDSLVIVNKKPVTTPIVGEDVVCYPNFNNKSYSTTGFANSYFDWFINSGTFNSGQGTPLVNVNWAGQQYNTLSVLETSDKGCPGDTIKFAVFADRPSIKMRYVSVGFPDDRMEIRWELINAPKFNSEFTIQRRTTGVPDSWRDVGKAAGNTIKYTETNINTDKTSFDYRIKAKDLCGNDIFSDIHTSILLTGNKEDLYEVLINWTRYQGWQDGVKTYEVHRSNDFETAYTLSKDKGSDTTDGYTDGFDNFNQRYRIRAHENGGNGDTSWSNEVSFDFDPVIWVPNAFTPNDDGINTKFKIVYGSIKKFEITIYDRWGEKLFYTDNINNNWDGTFKGRNCPDGVYVYVLRYNGANNISKTLMGNITLLR